MDLITQAVPWILIPTLALGSAWLTYRYLKQRQIRRQTQRVTRALSSCHAVFTALEHIPDNLINRDLRRGLVMLIKHNLELLRTHTPHHPHLYNLQARVSLLNRIPSGFQNTKLRDKVARRHASVAFEALAGILKTAQDRGDISQRDGALAYASAVFAGQQIAVDTARQAAKDAENIRAYRQALNFARQAQALCAKLPPLMRNTLNEAIESDIDRLQSMTGRLVKI